MRRLFFGAMPVAAAAIVGLTAVSAPAAHGQITDQDRQRAQRMLVQARKDLEEHYFDSTFGGWDINAAYQRAESGITAAKTPNHAFAMVAQFVSELNDSHTNFRPPSIAASVNYGVGMQPIGDAVRVTSIAREHDAATKDIRVGDQVIAWDRMAVDRRTLRIIGYVYGRLSPRPKITLTVLRDGDSTPRAVEIKATIKPRQRVIDETDIDVQRDILGAMEDASRRARHFYRSFGDTVLVWRLPSFIYGDREGIDEMMKLVRGRRGVVMDLRNNGGGAVVTLEYLIGKFFNRDVPYQVWTERGSDSLYVAKRSDSDPYLGMLVVLINSGSASASEIFSSTMQREGRAVIVGDRSAGAVVVSRTYWHQVGFGRVYDYAMQVSVADLRTPDGVRLEGAGVVPDKVVIPTADDLCKRRDPQLSMALSLVGVTISAEEAGRIWWSEKQLKTNEARLKKHPCL